MSYKKYYFCCIAQKYVDMAACEGLYNSVYSPLGTTTIDNVLQMAGSSHDFREFQKDNAGLEGRFNTSCTKLLIQKGQGN